jgi:hypothetical protein
LGGVNQQTIVATFRKPDGEIEKDFSYHEPIGEAREAAEEDAHRYGWEFLSVEVQ